MLSQLHVKCLLPPSTVHMEELISQSTRVYSYVSIRGKDDKKAKDGITLVRVRGTPCKCSEKEKSDLEIIILDRIVLTPALALSGPA